MSIMMDKFFFTYFPPGYDGETEIKRLVAAYLAAIVYSFRFFFSYYEAYNDLFYYEWNQVEETVKKVLRPGAVIVPFREIAGSSMLMFAGLAIVLLVAGLQHYHYYTKGSNSLYVVRRLPDRKYVFRTCFGGILLEAVAALVVIGILLSMYYCVYLWVTPEVCLP